MNAVARKVRDAIGEAALVGFESLDQIRGLLHEAATEIERLTKDHDSAEKRAVALYVRCNEIDAELDRANLVNRRLQETIDRKQAAKLVLQKEVEELKAELEHLREQPGVRFVARPRG